MALESTAWSARCLAMVQISRSKVKSASPTHSTWLSTQSTAIIIVALSGERRVGSVSRSIRKSRRWGLIRDGFHALDQPLGHAKGAPELPVVVLRRLVELGLNLAGDGDQRRYEDDGQGSHGPTVTHQCG